MAELLKERWAWVVAGVICLAALAFYLLPVRLKTRQAETVRDNLRARYQELGTFAKAGPLPNEAWVKKAKEVSQTVGRQVGECEEYFVRQRRDCHSRRFYVDASGVTRQFITDPLRWRQRYEQEYLRLAQQLRTATGREGGVLTFRSWGRMLPSDAEITATMMEFWLQKDLVTLLINSEPAELDEYIVQNTPQVINAFNLVRNKNPKEPTEALVQLVTGGRLTEGDLRDILKRMLGGAQGWNVEALLSRYTLRPHKAAAAAAPTSETVWSVVRTATSDEDQIHALARLQADNDWSNLYDFVVDLKTVRFRNDLAGLLENHRTENARFVDLLQFLKETDPAEQERLLRLIDRPEDWTQRNVAEAIGCLLSISAEEDYKLLLKNHRTPPIFIEGMTLVRLSTGLGGPVERGGEEPGPRPYEAGAPRGGEMGTAVSGLYYPLGFVLTVRIEFDKIPMLIRRLSTLDWWISIRNFQLRKSGVPVEGGPMSAPGLGRTLPPATGPEKLVEMRQVGAGTVVLVLTCEARSFLPLKLAKSAKAEPEKAAETKPEESPVK